MITQTQRVSYAFGRLPDGPFLDFVEGIMLNLFGNANFPTPPVDSETFGSSIAQFREAKALTGQGGTAATAEKNNKRAILYAQAKENGAYVTAKSNNDLAILLSSGYEAVSTNRASEQLDPPTNLRVKNGLMGQSLLTAQPPKNARGFELQYAEVPEGGPMGPWIDAPFSTSARNIPVDNLVSGRLYVYRLRAMGGSTGKSDWSESVSHRAY